MTAKEERFSQEFEDEKEGKKTGFDSDINFEKLVWIQLNRASEALSDGKPHAWNAVNTLADLLTVYQDEQYKTDLKEENDKFNEKVNELKEKNKNSLNAVANQINAERLNNAGKKFKLVMNLLGRNKLLLKGKRVVDI